MDGYLGEIRIFAGTFEPREWKFCNGQLLNISDFQGLFSILGNTYGGDGRTTFGLPDFRDRCVIGAGQGTGLTNHNRGDKVGTEYVQLTADQMPAHNHPTTTAMTGKIRCNDQLSDHASPVGNTLSVFKENRNAFNTQAADSDMHQGTVDIQGSVEISSTGGNQAHYNRQPSLGISYIICINGQFPPRP